MGWLRGLYSIPVCVLAATSLQAADAELPGYFPPGTRVVIGLRVRGLLDAVAAQGFGKEAQETVSKALAQNAIPGLDPFHDVDEILLGSSGIAEVNDKSDAILKLMTVAPPNGQRELAQHLINITQDDHYDGVAELLPKAAQSVGIVQNCG